MAYQPKSYRKFVATAATATLVASAVVPVASAASADAFKDVNSNYKVAVSYLVDNDIAKGKSDTLFGTDESITRGDAAVMIANALGLDTASAPDAGFKDVNARVAGAVNALVAKGIVSGKGAGTYAPDAKITRQEMAKILANAYELDGKGTSNKFKDVNSNWDAYVDALVKNEVTLGLTADTFGATADVTRGQFALFVYRAENITPAVTSVSSVTAKDAKTIEIKFTNAVNKDTLKNSAKADVITVSASEKAANPGAVAQTLSEDGKTLTLTATNFFKGDYTVKVPFEIVKDVKGNYVTPVNAKVTVDDKSAPVVQSATATVKDTKDNIKSITLTFDEAVKSIDTVKINGTNYSPNVSGTSKTVTVAVDLDATKTYDVQVVNAQDAVGNLKDVQTVALSLTVDNVAPTVTSVVPTGENTAKVTVDKALKNNSLPVTAKVGSFATNIVSKVEVNPDNNKEYFVTFNSAYLFKNGNSDVVTLTFAKEALEDTLGNKNASEISKTVSLTKDAAAPVVSKVETTVADGKVTGFTATFSEKVQSLDTSKVRVTNSKGEILPLGSVVATAGINAKDASKVDFTFASGLKGDKYTFEFAKGTVKDLSLAANESTVHTFTVDNGSATAPVETTFTIAGTTVPSTNVITVDFGAKVKGTGVGSALNPASYQVNGNVLPADTKIAFAGSVGDADYQTKVNITLPAGFVTASDEKAIFRVTGVQTLDNKVNNAYTALIPVVDNAAPEVKSFVATDLTKLAVTYSENVVVSAGNSAVTDEIQLFKADGTSVAITSYTVADGKLVLTVADAASVARVTTVKVDAANADIKDAVGNAQKSGVTVTK